MKYNGVGKLLINLKEKKMNMIYLIIKNFKRKLEKNLKKSNWEKKLTDFLRNKHY